MGWAGLRSRSTQLEFLEVQNNRYLNPALSHTSSLLCIFLKARPTKSMHSPRRGLHDSGKQHPLHHHHSSTECAFVLSKPM